MKRSFHRLVLSCLLGILCLLPERQLHAEMVVFSEVHFHSLEGKPEFVEIFNNSHTPFDIAKWRLTGGVEFEFPDFSALAPRDSFLRPKERIVVTGSKAATFRMEYAVPADIRVFGPWSGTLSDAGEKIALQDKNGAGLCELTYNDKRGWPLAADGFGHSLVLVDANRSMSDSVNWRASAAPGGSPGKPEPIPKLDEGIPVPDLELVLTNFVNHVDYGGIWRYQAPLLAVDPNWFRPAFDDSQWARGLGLFGFESAVLPLPGIRAPLVLGAQVAFYFRHRFLVPDLSPLGAAFVDLILDDGAVVYLNGQEIGRVRMPEGAIDGSTLAPVAVGDAVEELAAISLPASALLKGENVLAVEVHQTSRNSTDLVFGLRLRSALNRPPVVVFNELLLPANGDGFAEFYNRSAVLTNLKGHFLTHSLASPTLIQIAADLIVPAGGVGTVEVNRNQFPEPLEALYLVSTDGLTPVCSMRAPIPEGGSSFARRTDGGSLWVRVAVPTPSRPNQASAASNPRPVQLNEVRFGTSRVDWVEILNPNPFRLSLNGVTLQLDRGISGRIPLHGELPARGLAAFDLGNVISGPEVLLSLASEDGMFLDGGRFTPWPGISMQRGLDGNLEWYASTNSTRAAANEPAMERRVVINEIFCAPPSGEAAGEFIELYNRGSEAVDLSGWSISGGVRFVFPDGTALPSGGYLVVGASATTLRRVYGPISVVGDYEGRLSKFGENLRIEDRLGNLVNEVRYATGGDWPDWASGGGSSLELINPALDNSRASAWRDSDESAKGVFRNFAATGIYSVLRAMGAATDYKELHLYLAGEGHVVLDKIRLSRFGSSANLLLGVSQMSSTGAGDSGWLCQGTHSESFVQNGQLHLIADDRGDNRVNKAEIDAVGMNRNDAVTLSFSGKWITGSPRLMAQTWDRSFSASFRLEIPENLGSPGRLNSRYQEHPAPQLDELSHTPAVPRPKQKVRVTANVGSAEPLAKVELLHRLDNINGNGLWTVQPMFDDGVRGGDLSGGDGIHSAELDAYAKSGDVAQFYVRASTVLGAVAQLPKLGPEKPALFVVDHQEPPGGLRAERFVVSAYDLGAIANGGGADYNFKFPRLQNHYFNATFISEEMDVIYGISIRNTGSPWTRSDDLGRGKWKLPNDRRFRNRGKFVFDNDADGRISHNRVTRQLLYWMGQPVNEQEFIHLAINANPFRMKEETEPIDNDYLDRNFQNGSEGDLYRIDDEWWFADSGQQDYRNADWLYKFSDNAGLYRTSYMRRTKEDQDDYSALIGFFKVVSTGYTQEKIEQLIDPEAVLKIAAVRGYVADWDFFSMNRGKNAWFYRRPVDGRFQFLHWDSDQAFGDVTRTFQAGVPGYDAWARQPYNVRQFNAYLAEILERYSLHSPRFTAWMRAEEESSSAYTANAEFYNSWFERRHPHALTWLGTNYGRMLEVFPVTDGGGSVQSDFVDLRGTAPYGLTDLRLPGHPEARLQWNSDVHWRFQGVALREGTNQLMVEGLDSFGRLVRQTSELFVKRGNAPPIARFIPDGTDWRVSVRDAVEVDGRVSIDPEGSNLAFDWKVDPSIGILMQTNIPGRCVLQASVPGLYEVSMRCTDDHGNSSQFTNTVAVYGPGGLSRFDQLRLEDHWTFQGVDYRDNHPTDTWLSLTEPANLLTLAILEDASRPLSFGSAAFPSVFRELPRDGDWAFSTDVAIANGADGELEAGIVLDLMESGELVRYIVSLSGSGEIIARRLDGSSVTGKIASEPARANKIGLRARKQKGRLLLESTASGSWTRLTSAVLPASVRSVRAGLFVSSAEVKRVVASFTHALFVDPSVISPLQQSIRITELMYGPPGGDAYEFLEIVNAGLEAADLTGARFTNGISYAFGPTSLGVGARIVLCRDRGAFASRYGIEGRSLAPGAYAGKLDNAGERLTLVDAESRIIFDFTYGSSGSWPGRADGSASSLEPVGGGGNLSNASSWRSSLDYLGSPGAPGIEKVSGIVINELLSNSTPPFEKAIELFNSSHIAVNVGGWFLSDTAAQLKKFRIPDPTVIPPRGFLAFYEYQFAQSDGTERLSLDGNRAGDLWLVAADALGNVTEFVDHVEFDPSSQNRSSGRYPDGAAAWRFSLTAPTFGSPQAGQSGIGSVELFRAGMGAPNLPPLVGPLVVSRIQYNPLAGGDEFIELANMSEAPLALFDSLHPTNRWRVSKGIQFVFPQGAQLAPNQRVLLTGSDPERFRMRNRLGDGTVIFGPFEGALNNGGETIQVDRPLRPVSEANGLSFVPFVPVDHVRYDSAYPWPGQADGQGSLLSRVDLAAPAESHSDWLPEDPGFESDTDGDGMLDRFELLHGLNPTDPSDALMDADRDGFTNGQEFLAGTNPLIPAGRFEITRIVYSANQLSVRFNAVPGRTYRVLRSEKLVPAEWIVVAELMASGQQVELEARDLPAGFENSAFFRIVTP